MMITIELPPEVEAGFAALAAKQGVALPDLLLHLLEEQMPPRIGASLSPAERARLWRSWPRACLTRRHFLTLPSVVRVSMTLAAK